MGEMNRAIRIMKNKKAAGIDVIMTEQIKLGLIANEEDINVSLSLVEADCNYRVIQMIITVKWG